MSRRDRPVWPDNSKLSPRRDQQCDRGCDGSPRVGSQPNHRRQIFSCLDAFPQWWPLGTRMANRREPVRYVWRTMRVDVKDLALVPHRLHYIDRESDKYKTEVYRAALFASNYHSPWLHVASTWEGANWFASAGQTNRNEQVEDQILCRIDLKKLYDQGIIRQHSLIDLQNAQAFEKYFWKGPVDYGWPRNLADNWNRCKAQTSKNQELMLEWRGEIPWDAFEVHLEGVIDK